MSSTGTSPNDQPYATEYMTMIHLAPQSDGKYRIIALKEYIDSRYMCEFFAEERRRERARA